MTKVWLISDLHTEAAAFELPATPESAEVLVIAGDICENPGQAVKTALGWQRQCGLPTVFVPGNHDFYGSDLGSFDNLWSLELAAEAGLHVLHSGQSVIVNGTKFIGATLWTDFLIADDFLGAAGWFKSQMPDHRAIDVGQRRVTARDLQQEHIHHLVGLQRELQKPFGGCKVVVTHHAPHKNSLSDPGSIDHSDASFASDLSKTIEQFRPNAWLHGHVHQSCDYVHAETWVVSNPRGYVQNGRENVHFNPSLVLEVC